MDDSFTPIYFDDKSIILFVTPSNTLVRMSPSTFPRIRSRTHIEEANSGSLYTISLYDLEVLTGYGR